MAIWFFSTCETIFRKNLFSRNKIWTKQQITFIDEQKPLLVTFDLGIYIILINNFVLSTYTKPP